MAHDPISRCLWSKFISPAILPYLTAQELLSDLDWSSSRVEVNCSSLWTPVKYGGKGRRDDALPEQTLSCLYVSKVPSEEAHKSKESSGRDVIWRFNSPFIVKLDNPHGIDQSVLDVALAHPAACALGTGQSLLRDEADLSLRSTAGVKNPWNCTSISHMT
jgi:hypothetical protein